MELGALGVWFATDGQDAQRAAETAQRIEQLGYSALWIPEAVGRDPLAHAAWLLAKTQRLIVATGIANIYARDANAMTSGRNTLAEQSGGRFLLGIGVSHQPMVEGVRGHAYGKPVDTMRAYLDRMEKAPYFAPAPPEPPPTVLAALGPQMLALAARRTRGAHPYLVPPEHTAKARGIMGPAAWLCPEQKVLLETSASKAREVARKGAAIYLSLDNYRRNLKRLGFRDADLEGGGSDRLIDAVVAWGDEKAIAERVQAHRDAGATHVCIQPLRSDGAREPDWRILEALAPRR